MFKTGLFVMSNRKTIFHKLMPILTYFVFSVSTVFFAIAVYVRCLYKKVDYEQLINTMMQITPQILLENVAPKDAAFVLAALLIVWIFGYFVLKNKSRLVCSAVMLVTVLWLSGYIKYLYINSFTSTLYEENYVNPTQIKFDFPAKKRNLIVIYLESFEQDFALEEYQGKNLIPNLSSLQNDENHSFAYHQIYGTDYSISAFVSGSCGIPLRMLKERNINDTKYFLPQAVCFQEILAQNGYQTAFIKAADLGFADTDIFTKTHGYQKSMGYNELTAKYPYLKGEKYKGVFGGITDRGLYEIAKKEVYEFKQDEPFLLTLFSLDTHETSFSYSHQACKTYFGDLRDQYICSDAAVYEFVEWLKKQLFWENTTLIIVGDHPAYIYKGIKETPNPKIYNVFLNLPQKMPINPNKDFSTMDFAPTFLESIGIKIKPRAYGLGRSLFSKEPTLSESLGDSFNDMVQQKSVLYSKLAKAQNAESSKFESYELGAELDNNTILGYTDVSENIFKRNYIDRMNIKFEEEITTDLLVKLEFSAVADYGSKITFYVDGKEVADLKVTKSTVWPQNIQFMIKKQDITDNKVRLKFRNNKGVRSVLGMGIAPLKLSIDKIKE